MDFYYELTNQIFYFSILLLLLVYITTCTIRAVRDKAGVFFGELSPKSVVDIIRNMEINKALDYVILCQREVLILKGRNVCLNEIWRCKTVLRDYSHILASLQAKIICDNEEQQRATQQEYGRIVLSLRTQTLQDRELPVAAAENEAIAAPLAEKAKVEAKKPSIRAAILALKMAYANGEYKVRIGNAHAQELADRYGWSKKSCTNWLSDSIEQLQGLCHKQARIQLYEDALLTLQAYDKNLECPKTIAQLEGLLSKEENSL